MTPESRNRQLQSCTAHSFVVAGIAAAAVTLCLTAAHAQDAAVRRRPASLVMPVSGTAAPDADGFIRRWLVLEPIRVGGQLTDTAVQTAVKTEYFRDQFTVIPRDGDTVMAGGAQLRWHALDTTAYNVNLYHFAYALEKPTSNVLFWAVTAIDAPRDLSGVRLAIGSNAASVWWVNGEEVIAIYNDRQTVIDDGVSRRVTLKKGANIVRGAIINAGGATDFCARFLDAEGKPLNGFSVRLDSGNSR